jgi:uncharacterized protein (TIGR03435 family)
MAVTILIGVPASSQPPQPAFFEVASIKPWDGDENLPGQKPLSVDKSRVEFRGITAAMLIAIAYELKQPHEIEEGPWAKTWAGKDRFTIQAKIPESASERQVPEMLRTLLAQRFGLLVHRESKMLRSYALTVAKGGPKFKEAFLDSTGNSPTPGMETAFGKRPQIASIPGGLRVEHDQMTMEMLASRLSQFLEAPVADLTGLKGRYGVKMDLMIWDRLDG